MVKSAYPIPDEHGSVVWVRVVVVRRTARDLGSLTFDNTVGLFARRGFNVGSR